MCAQPANKHMKGRSKVFDTEDAPIRKISSWHCSSPGCVDTGIQEMDVDEDIEKSASLYFVDGIIK